jgi:uncharacterized protein YjbI with pentapeptide repeats
LGALIAPSQKHNDNISTLDKIHPIARAIINPQFRNTTSDRLYIPRIAHRQPPNPNVNPVPRLPIAQSTKPLSVTFRLPNLNHNASVSYEIHLHKISNFDQIVGWVQQRETQHHKPSEIGTIGDPDVKVKWNYPCAPFCPGVASCTLETKVMTAEELLERYASGERDFSRAELSNTNLSELDLSGSDFTEAHMEGVILQGACLQNCNFLSASLSNANLINTDLRESNFLEATLYETNLSSANLTGTKFDLAWLVGAILNTANLSNASLSGTSLENASLVDALLENTIFSYTTLVNTNMMNATLIGAQFSDCFYGQTILPNGNIINDGSTIEIT